MRVHAYMHVHAYVHVGRRRGRKLGSCHACACMDACMCVPTMRTSSRMVKYFSISLSAILERLVPLTLSMAAMHVEL